MQRTSASSIFELASPKSKYFKLAEGDLPAGIAAARDAVLASPFNGELIGQLEAAVKEQVMDPVFVRRACVRAAMWWWED